MNTIEQDIFKTNINDGFSNLEITLIYISIFLSPFWFLTLFGVNLGPTDLFLLTAAVLFTLRTKMYLLGDRVLAAVIFVFLLFGAISISQSPRPITSLLNYIQYIFIFLVYVPVLSSAINTRQRSIYFLYCLYIPLIVIFSIAFITWTTTEQPVTRIYLWYGNQNQLLWLVSSLVVIATAIVFDETFNIYLRIGNVPVVISAVYYVLHGQSFTSFILIGGGMWIVIGYWCGRIKTHQWKAILGFVISNTLAAIISGYLLITNLQVAKANMSLDTRYEQYTAAVNVGYDSQPFGTGLRSTDITLAEAMPGDEGASVHNFFLAYFVEIGVIGAIAFSLILLVWLLNTTRTILNNRQKMPVFTLGLVSIFVMYMIVILFQPVPVRRYWWVLFSYGLALVYREIY